MKALLLIVTLACAGCVSPEAKPEQEGQAAEKEACPETKEKVKEIPKDPFIRLLYLLAAVASIHR